MRSLNAIHCSYYKLHKVEEVAVVSNCMEVEVSSLVMVLCAEITGLLGIKMVTGVCVCVCHFS